MKLKLDAEGHAVLSEGKPVYVHDDGKEVAFDYSATLQTISRLNGEAKSHRERAETLEGKVKAFEGIEDPAAAKKALDTVKNLDHKKLVDAGEIEKVKEEVTKALKTQYEPVVAEVETLRGQLSAEKIGNAFANSKFIAEQIAIPRDMLRATFGNNFKIEDGRIIAYGQDGSKVYSRARPGEVADFEEAIESIVGAYAFKDQILKAPNASGDGKQKDKGSAGGAKTIRRGEFDALDPVARNTKVREGFQVVD